MTNLSALHVYLRFTIPDFVFGAAGVALCYSRSRVLRLPSASSDNRNLQTAKPALTIQR